MSNEIQFILMQSGFFTGSDMLDLYFLHKISKAKNLIRCADKIPANGKYRSKTFAITFVFT